MEAVSKIYLKLRCYLQLRKKKFKITRISSAVEWKVFGFIYSLRKCDQSGI